MNGVPIAAYLGLGLFMFCTGVTGVIIRRNPIVIFMCIELMLNSVNLTFLTFARYQMTNPGTEITAQRAVMSGEMMVIFVMAVAAAEVAVGLGIIMTIFRSRNNVDIDELNLLRG
jgi:NADH-quinone oxidoreductase subunit K